MANIKKMAMAKAMANDNRIVIKSSLLGLSTSIVYQPTGSKVTCYSYEYSADKGNKIKDLLSREVLDEQKIKALGTVKSDTIGNMRLEAMLSADRQFAALQLFQYSDFLPTPLTSLRIFEGSEAEKVATLF